MTNSNSNYNMNVQKNKVPKSKGFWFVLFAVEIVVFILCGLFTYILRQIPCIKRYL